MNFDVVFAARSWVPIRGCPGRYGLAAGAVTEAPASLAPGAGVQEFVVSGARDVVVVVRFVDSGGLISYRRADGTYMHTLNTEDGLTRKLTELGITLA